MSETKTLSEVYEDRNALAVAFCAAVRELAWHTDESTEWRTWWELPDEEDDADAEEWAVLYAWTPTGQVSWHIPRELAESTGLPRSFGPWDGHTRTEKNNRLLALARYRGPTGL